MAGIVVVFDFDKTIIDCDSDNWVVDDMGATDLFNELLPTMPWNSLMNRMMKELQSQGRTIGEIADSLKRATLHPRVITAIKSAYDFGCDLRIVSDANLFFIETVLKHHSLMDYFSEINTNPSFVDENGKLRIFPYHDFSSNSHGCELCPPNMCKGPIMERIRTSVLRDEVHEWIYGEELARVLLHLINTTTIEDNNTSVQLISADCKLQTIPLSSDDALPHVLPVPH
ncbi:hypothetical protein AAC387_Pa03g4415 [Persea americana]